MSITALVLLASFDANALDLYQDRRGPFTGIGFGGGAAFQNGDPGGAFFGDLQVGGGASEHLTLNLDVDVWFQLMDTHKNWLVNPGPELTYFFGDTGLYARAGIAMAFVYTLKESKKNSDVISGDTPKTTDDNEFNLGGDFTLGFGYEFFMNSNLALDFGLEGDYVLKDGSDIISAAFTLGIRYY